MSDYTHKTLDEKPFELSAWALLTGIGAVRILKDIVQDLFREDQRDTSLLTDVPLLLVFLFLLYLIIRNKITVVPVWVGIVLLLLTTWSFIRLGGVEGSSEYNFMALAVMYTLCYRGRDLTFILIALFGIIILVNIDQLQHGRITERLQQRTTYSHDTFYTTLTVIGVVLLYFKELLKVETSKVRDLRRLMTRRHSLIRKQHEELRQQKLILLEATRRLREDVKDYDDIIKQQNQALHDFIYLSTQNLRLSMARMQSVPGALPKSEGLTHRLTEQIVQLKGVVSRLIVELDQSDHGSIH